MTWIVYLCLFLGILYLFQKPQHILVLFFHSCKLVYFGYRLGQIILLFCKTGVQKTRRYYLLKTKKFEKRVVMQPPNLSTINKKKF